MKKFEILQELPKYDSETQNEQMLLEKNGINMLAQCRVATNLCFVKNTMSVRYNKAKCNKMRYAYILKIGTSLIFKYLLTHL